MDQETSPQPRDQRARELMRFLADFVAVAWLIGFLGLALYYALRQAGVCR